jgi:NADH-ubiquinone oxidoreductase chain 3
MLFGYFCLLGSTDEDLCLLNLFMLTGLAILFSVILVLVLLFVLSNLISEGVNLDREELSSYECGFEHHSLSRIPLSLRYYFLTMIFLVFDMEIMFLLFVPYNTLGVYSSLLGSLTSLLFVVALLLGLIYE